MTLANIPLDVQQYILLGYETQFKIIILVGWFLLALFYVFYLYKTQKPTPFFLVGTARASLYIMAYLYLFFFWLLFPFYLHPNVALDVLQIFIFSAYSIIFFTFWVMFVFNFTIWIPKAIFKFGRLDIKTWEDYAIKNYFGDFSKWFKK